MNLQTQQALPLSVLQLPNHQLKTNNTTINKILTLQARRQDF